MTRHARGRSGIPDLWWRRILLADLTTSERYPLLVLSTRMTGTGTILGTGEKSLATDLGVSRPRIAERLAAGRRAELLQTLGSPAPGRPVDYQAILAPPRRDCSIPFPTGRAPLSTRRSVADTIVKAPATTACKVLLLAFVHMMDAGGVVYGLRREDLAELLGREPNTVRNLIAEAKAEGLLVLIDGGTRGRKARYQLTANRTVERYTIAATCTGEQYPESGTHGGGQIGLRVPVGGTHNARAIKNQTLPLPLVSGEHRGTVALGKNERRSEGGSGSEAEQRRQSENQLGSVQMFQEEAR